MPYRFLNLTRNGRENYKISGYEEGDGVVAMCCGIADEGRAETVRLLIEAGANVNARDEDGETALDKAIDERNHKVAELLRAAGAR